MSDTTLMCRRVRDVLKAMGLEESRGAQAYVQAYEYISFGNGSLSQRTLRGLAMDYLKVTQSPPLSRLGLQRARIARRLIARASRLDIEP